MSWFRWINTVCHAKIAAMAISASSISTFMIRDSVMILLTVKGRSTPRILRPALGVRLEPLFGEGSNLYNGPLTKRRRR
jgi:hypothetical protein